MVLDKKQRQKKLARKQAKSKAKLAERKSKPIVGNDRLLLLAARFPIHECLVPEDLFDTGIGHLVLSRVLPNGEFAIAAFLVDVYCLGVKDALHRVVSQQEYDYYRSQIESQTRYESIHPSCLRKLVEGAVRYARDLGFAPHADYARAARLFGDIQAAACPVRYTYGKNGQPFYIGGPNESAAQSRRILETLARRHGSEEIRFITAADTPDPAQPATRQLALLGYSITEEPLHEPAYEQLPERVKEQINELYHQAQEQPKQAITMLLSLIEQYPDLPKLYNFLSVAYQVLGDRDNARKVLDETLERFPDYLFGRISYANDCLERGELDKVSEIFEGKFELKLLYPERECFHISEVMNFNTLMARYDLARGNRAQAEIRYKLLRQLDPEHPHTQLVGRALAKSRLSEWIGKILPRR